MNKYIICASIILNGILLMTLLGIIPFLLYLSILIILAMFWYTKKIIEKNKELEDDITQLVEDIDGFSSHLEEIHALEIYYGDENLQNLIEHSRNLINNFIDFQQIYFDVEVEEVTEEEEEDEDEEA